MTKRPIKTSPAVSLLLQHFGFFGRSKQRRLTCSADRPHRPDFPHFFATAVASFLLVTEAIQLIVAAEAHDLWLKNVLIFPL